MPLTGNVFKALVKRLLVPLGLTTASSAMDAAIQMKNFGSGLPVDLSWRTTSLILSNEELNDIIYHENHEIS